MNALFTSVLLALALAPTADDVTIRWKLAKDDTFYTKTVTVMEQTMSVMGNDMEQNHTQTAVSKYKVLKADETGTVIEQTTVRTVVEGNIPGIGDAAKKMNGSVLKFTLDPEMKVTKIEGFQDMLNKIADVNDEILKVIKASISEDMYKMSVEDLFRVGTAKPIAVGDTWKKNYDMPLGPLGHMEMNTKYKYEGPESGLEKITFTADAKFGPPKEGAELGPVTIVKADLKTDSFSGTILFDSKAGRLKEVKSEMKMNGSMTMKAMGNEIEIGIKQKTKSTNTVSTNNPADD